MRMVLRQGMTLSLTGLAVGMAITLLVARTLQGLLYGVEPHDPATLLAASGTLAFVSALACLAPARRATAVDPVTVLKSQ
jgi:ABC-type antimicrobial peptide transport system permease subunit